MKNPEISVIVTNYKHSDYIEQAVESISEQTMGDFEIIIVDDCSDDDGKSREVIQNLVKTDDRIQKPIFLEKNMGKWFALNTAIATAKAPLITLQDADDASCKERLERQLYVLNEWGSFHTLCGFSHCHNQDDMDIAMRWSSKSSIGYKVIEHQDVTKNVLIGHKTPGINHYFAGRDYEVHGASALYYKQLWDFGMKYLPGNIGLRCQRAEDSDHNTKMTLLLQKTSVLKEPLYCYRRGSSTNNAYLEEL